MTPLPLGILALAGAGGGGGAFDLLETTTLATSASSVTFSGLDTLAAGYQHLQIRMVAKMSSTTESYAVLGFNGVTGNYAIHRLEGDGSTVISTADTGPSRQWIGYLPLSSDTGVFASAVIDILDFSSSSKNTTSRSLFGLNKAYSRIALNSGLFKQTDAVTAVNIHTNSSSFGIGSRFSLIGVK